MKFEETSISGLYVIYPQRHGDERGFFSEVWKASAFTDAGLEYRWCQDNHSYSQAVGVLRGLHYQAPPRAQAKLVRCTRGALWDVAVDVRPGSPSYGKWFGLELSAENWTQLLIPRGFLHGFVTLVPDTEIQYKVDNPYAPECDGAVAWDDAELAIKWPLKGPPQLSGKDRNAPAMAQWQNPFGKEV